LALPGRSGDAEGSISDFPFKWPRHFPATPFNGHAITNPAITAITPSRIPPSRIPLTPPQTERILLNGNIRPVVLK
jgi:hypothetical protein